jgi:hypothetical protein
LRAIGAAALYICGGCRADDGTQDTRRNGCFFAARSDSAVAQGDPRALLREIYRRSTGDRETDHAISNVLYRAARAFAFVRSQIPAFRFLPPGEAGGGDGLACDAIEMQPGTKGLVAVGLDLLNSNSTQESSRLAFEVIVGHEFAHIYQARHGYVERLAPSNSTVRLLELHADYLAGWFMSKKGDVLVTGLEPVVDALFSRGEYAFNDPSHHGTKADRFTAALQGFLQGGWTDQIDGAAVNGISYLNKLLD